MVREVVVHANAGHFADQILPAPHALELRDRLDQLADRAAVTFGGRGDRCDGVAHVVNAG
jgi:hypothetical protein